MTDYALTTGTDAILGTSGDDTINATSSTLSAGDSITGGVGTDTLALYGTGTFHIDQVTLGGVESITSNDISGGSRTFYLGSDNYNLSLSGAGSTTIYNGNGTFQIHSSGYAFVYTYRWDSSDVFIGGETDFTDLRFGSGGSFDLRTNTLHVSEIDTYATGVSLTIDSSVAANVGLFYGGGSNDTLTTTDAALDLSTTHVTGFAVTSTNPRPTTSFKMDRDCAPKAIRIPISRVCCATV